MLEQGYDEEEIKRKVASYREILKEKDPTINKVGVENEESGRTIAESTHEIAKLNEAQQIKLKKAFGIREDYQSGNAFDPQWQQQQRKKDYEQKGLGFKSKYDELEKSEWMIFMKKSWN